MKKLTAVTLLVGMTMAFHLLSNLPALNAHVYALSKMGASSEEQAVFGAAALALSVFLPGPGWIAASVALA